MLLRNAKLQHNASCAVLYSDTNVLCAKVMLGMQRSKEGKNSLPAWHVHEAQSFGAAYQMKISQQHELTVMCSHSEGVASCFAAIHRCACSSEHTRTVDTC